MKFTIFATSARTIFTSDGMDVGRIFTGRAAVVKFHLPNSEAERKKFLLKGSV